MTKKIGIHKQTEQIVLIGFKSRVREIPTFSNRI